MTIIPTAKWDVNSENTNLLQFSETCCQLRLQPVVQYVIICCYLNSPRERSLRWSKPAFPVPSETTQSIRLTPGSLTAVTKFYAKSRLSSLFTLNER